MDIQLKRGLLDVCVLAAIKNEDSYGYKIIKDMKPYIELSESTLYTILKRLEAAEMLTVRTAEHDGRLRKYYHITDVGLKRIEDFKEEWREIMSIYRFVTRGNKQEFLTELRAKLSGLPTDDVEERLGFYGEMIDDRTEEGVTEEQAVEEMGTVDQIASQIISEVPLTKIVREKIKPKRRLKAWEIALIVAGSPVWLALTIATLAVIFSLFAAMWAVIAALWASLVALGVCSVGGVVYGVVLIAGGGVTTGFEAIGVALICAGLTVFAFFGCLQATKGALQTRKVVDLVKNRIVNG